MTGGLPSEPPAQLPAGVIALVGWTNRLMLVASWAWATAVAERLSLPLTMRDERLSSFEAERNRASWK